MKKPLVLMILDGWGVNPNPAHNAVALAHTPHLSGYLAAYPHTTILTSGMAVGLPEGQMGNSEVGHLNLGAGRVVYQELTRVSKAIVDGDFFTNRVFLDCIATVKASGGGCTWRGFFPMAESTPTIPTCTHCWNWPNGKGWQRCSSTASLTAGTRHPRAVPTIWPSLKGR